jgi:hypothetical protein
LRKSEFHAIRFLGRWKEFGPCRARGGKAKERREIFLFFPLQPIEKSGFGRIKPSKSKPFYLDQLGQAWSGLA